MLTLQERPNLEAEEAQLRRLIVKHDALSETRELALKASKNAVAHLASVQGEAATGDLLREIPEALLSRSM
jgi:octaprenyl-diphosphate synthase